MDLQLQHRTKDSHKDNAKVNITTYLFLITLVVAVVFIVLYALELRDRRYKRCEIADGNNTFVYIKEDITKLYKLNILDCEQLYQTDIQLSGNFTVSKYCEFITNHSLLNTKYNELMIKHNELNTMYNEIKTNYSKLMTNYSKLMTNWTTLDSRVNKFVNGVSAGNISVYPSGWNWIPFQKSFYHFSRDFTNWTDANDTCASISCSSLVIIDDIDEQKFLEDYTKEKQWIGLRKDPAGYNFQWVNGAALNIHMFWAVGEPNNEQTELCVTKGAEFNVNKWNNDQCSASHRRICEFKPECYVRKKLETGD